MSRLNSNLLNDLQARQNNGRLHVELTPELEEWMLRTFRGDRDRADIRIRRMRNILVFQTDLVDQIFERPNGHTLLGVIGSLGETHAVQSELASRGLGSYLARVAVENNLIEQPERNRVLLAWLFPLYFSIDYLQDSEITCDMIDSLTAILNVSGKCLRSAIASGDVESNGYRSCSRFVKTTLETLSSIALRGSSVRHLFDQNLNTLVQFCTCFVEDNLSVRLEAQENVVFQTCLALASFAAMVENPVLVEPAIIYFRWVRVLRYDTEEVLGHSISNLTKRVVVDVSDCRPAENLYAYLSLCSFTASSQVRFIGAIALTVVLDLLDKGTVWLPHHDAEPLACDITDVCSVFDRPRCDTPASRTYTRHALESRLRDDATMLGCHVDRLRSDYQRSSGPHSFLAEAVLRLLGDVSPEVRKIGRTALDRVPRHVLQQAVWSPSLHRRFCDEGKVIVTSMLILSRRGDVPLPVDILVSFVFPFACTAVM